MPPARILIVDDDAAILVSAKRLFSPRHRVVTADRPSRGLDALRAETFDLVVADFRMPEMTGLEFLEQVRQLRPDVIPVLITGARDFDTVVTAVNRSRIFRVVAKPFEIAELEEAVNAAIDFARLREERDRFANELVGRNDALARINENLEAQVRAHTREVLHTLTDALDFRGGETPAHSRRSATYARLLGERMRLPPKELESLELGSLLHDVGTLGIPEAVLLKRGPLTMDDWTQVRRHPTLGWDFLQRISFLGDSSFICLEHHERWDGKGYPRSIAGETIRLGARIFAVIDAYDAMTSDRPYRKALGAVAARAELTRCSGKQFDPRIVEVFLGIAEPQLAEIRAAARPGLADTWTRLG